VAFDVVIVGAGEAGVTVALTLRAFGFAGSIKLIGDEAFMYHRPPLSKSFLQGAEGLDDIRSVTVEDLSEQNIDTSVQTRVTAVDRVAKTVTTSAGDVIGYGHLVLATGASNRAIAGPEIVGVTQLRTVADGHRLREALLTHDRVVIVGAGFLGLEVASVAADLGLHVDVVELAPAPLGGRVSSATVQAVEQYLRSRGIRFALGVGVDEFIREGDQLVGVRLSDGSTLDTRLALTCVGVVPNVDLALEAGLDVNNGVDVDSQLRSTADPDISVIGDVSSYENHDGERIRVESIANATAMAQTVALRLTGSAASDFSAVPWFWSIYGPHRLELVGMAADVDEVIVHGDPLAYDFAAYCFKNGQLVRFESLNRPREHMKMRRSFERGVPPTPAEISDPAFSFVDWKAV
jgi:3-phenylpropionate/trans-cinnamate dioxygenase ferredoxin reductase subunit